MEYQHRLVRIGDRIKYMRAYGEIFAHDTAMVADLTETTIYLDNGSYLPRQGIEYDSADESPVFVR